MRSPRPARSVIAACLVFLAVAGGACAKSAPEAPQFEIPSEVVPDWINPTDAEALFPDIGGCYVTVGEGVRVLQVFEGTGAHGVLRAGDIITSVDGIPITSREALLMILEDRLAGESVRLRGTRAGNPISMEIELTPAPEGPERGIIGIFPETRLRVAQPSSLPSRSSAGPVGEPVMLDGALYSYSPLTARWAGYGEVAGILPAVGLGSELYAVSSGVTPALVRLGDEAAIPIDTEPALFDLSISLVGDFTNTMEAMLTSVGDLLVVAGWLSDGESGAYTINGVNPVDGTVAWTHPLGLSSSGLFLMPAGGYRSPSGDRAVVSLVEQDPATGSRSEVLTYVLVDERGEGITGPPGIDRFIPTEGVTGWYDDDSLAYVFELGDPGVAVWNLASGDHARVWPVPPEAVSDLVTVIPVGDGRHLVQVRAGDVSLIDVLQPAPVRPIARGCRFSPMNTESVTGPLPAATSIQPAG